MESDLHCPICNTQYGSENVPRLLAFCGHTFCHLCLDTLFIQQQNHQFRLECPLDKGIIHLNNNDVSQFPKNITLIKLIERKKAAAAEFKQESSLEITNIQKNQDSHQNQSWQQIINQIGSEEPFINTIAQNQSNKSQNKSINSVKSENTKNEKIQSIIRKQNQFCKIHNNRPLQIICVMDLQRLCAMCAIGLPEHKNHDFKSIQQIEQQSDIFRLNLFKIYDEIQQIKKRIEDEQNVKGIIQVLDQKRKKLMKQLGDRYKKLRQRIKKNEEMVMKQLQDMYANIEKKIRQIISIDKNIINQYQQWQSDMSCELQKLEEAEFTQKARIIYGKHHQDIMLKGEDTLIRIKQNEKVMESQIQQVIDIIKTQYNDEIYSILDNFTILKLQQIKPKPKPNDHLDNFVEESLLQGENNDLSMEAKTYINESYADERDYSIEKIIFNENIKPYYIKQTQKVEQKIDKNNKLKPIININVPATHQNQPIQYQSVQRPPKKKLKSIKVPEKIQKILEALYNDSLELLDLTNAQLGDGIILQICEFLRCSRVRTVKFIRNKLSDECILKMIPSLGGVITLNISQNYLTQQSLIYLANNRSSLHSIKNIILSQNKINERKHKQHIERLKNMDLNLSI